jgi:hypothetical protein
MYWYFADRCAGLFPWRHSFQTHYQFPFDQEPNKIGEQLGSRPYSKGFGPIGAPHDGLTWQGELSSFIAGVPALDAGPVPLICPASLIGGNPLPPPSTWTEVAVDLSIEYGGQPAFEGNQVDTLHWHFVGDEGGTGDLISAEWVFEAGYGMRLTGFTVGGGGPPADPSTWPYAFFVSLTETSTLATWKYSVSSPTMLPQVWSIVVVKCVP